MVTPSRTTRTRPLTTMKKPVPISPWRAIGRSAGNSTSTAPAAMAAAPRRRGPGTAGTPDERSR